MVELKERKVAIPTNWRKDRKSGRYMAKIDYTPELGRLDIKTIPDCVVSIATPSATSIIFYSENKPIITEGTCLIFDGNN